MNDFILHCNIPKCKVPLTETAWVTRCMHVFCPRHGQAYFSTSSPQIHCPICNDINLKEVDILHCETNPSDMILAGISPEKAIVLASKSLKLWRSQIQENHLSYSQKANQYEKMIQEMKYRYNKMLNKTKTECEKEIHALKVQMNSLTKRCQELNNELVASRGTLQKYKAASESRRPRNIGTSSISPHWVSNVDNLLFESPSPQHNTGFEFSFDEKQIFN